MNLTTKDTATMEAISNGFFMRDIRVDNTAGPENHQIGLLEGQTSCSHSLVHGVGAESSVPMAGPHLSWALVQIRRELLEDVNEVWLRWFISIQ
ncbi:hypothetical protein ZEAMMB73_Zm00001d007209 [Zea mays]|uniref:Uncharacterized protein n=1 Tax=Zea mays TaxID=4577 RepID=A0A1D6F4U1_MAIZE|nr:hypothetical protein ZEAMMB73_Zm00001d007209 [Zea mays]